MSPGSALDESGSHDGGALKIRKIAHAYSHANARESAVPFPVGSSAELDLSLDPQSTMLFDVLSTLIMNHGVSDLLDVERGMFSLLSWRRASLGLGSRSAPQPCTGTSRGNLRSGSPRLMREASSYHEAADCISRTAYMRRAVSFACFARLTLTSIV
jgi:hypothetical protein